METNFVNPEQDIELLYLPTYMIKVFLVSSRPFFARPYPEIPSYIIKVVCLTFTSYMCSIDYES